MQLGYNEHKILRLAPHCLAFYYYCASIMSLILSGGCTAPSPPVDGFLSPFSATNEGAEVVYCCDAGFQPQGNNTAVCGSNGVWRADPAQHQCRGECMRVDVSV